MRKTNPLFSIIDIIFVLFVLSIICSSFFNDSTILNTYLIVIIPCYFIFRLLDSIISKFTDKVALLISVICLFECGLGLLQLIGSFFEEFSTSLCGTFRNTGSFGGFISVCICILFPYTRKCKNSFVKKIASTSLTVAVVVLPASFSRAALLSCAVCCFLFAFKNENSFKEFINSHKLPVVLVLIVLAIGAYKFKQGSADGRIFIDKISVHMLSSNKLFGIGIGRYAGKYGETQYLYFHKKMSNIIEDSSISEIEHERMIADCPELAFNDYLQIGAESGLVAMLLYVIMIIVAVYYSMKRHVIWGYGLLSFSIFSFFSFPIELLQFQLLFSILLAMSSSVSCGEKSSKYTYILLFPILFSSSFILSNLRTLKDQRDSIREWGAAGKWYDKGYYEFVISDYSQLFDDLKNKSQFLFEYGRSLNKTGNYEKSDSILKIGIELSSDPMFWNVMGNNSLALGKYREAEERYKHAFYMVPNRLYPLYLLAKLYHTEGDTARFLDMADRVETFIPKVESINTERLRGEIRELKNDYLSEATKKDD